MSGVAKPRANRPLVICDCDEVLLRMVGPFRDWLASEHEIDFTLKNDFSDALHYRATGEPVERHDVWRLLAAFFDTEMDRQDPFPGAIEALNILSETADVVILTNLLDERAQARKAQLAGHGLDIEVYTNQGPKGPAIRRIVEEHAPGKVAFIDDLPQHHASAAQDYPDSIRLHMCGEPELSPHIDCAYEAGHAHARIDSWDEALPWLLERL